MKILVLSALALGAFFSTHEAPPPAMLRGDWTIDGVHSSVSFRIMHANATPFRGMFKAIEGTISLDLAASKGGEVAIKIDAGSVDTRDEKRDQHLKGPDFFDAKQFPEITFASTEITKAGEDEWTVKGDLEMHGVKKPVVLRAKKTGEGEFHGKRIGFEVTGKIKRSDFGMEYGIAQKVLGDAVDLEICVEAVEAKAKDK